MRDLVQAVYLAIEHGVRQRAYFVSDGNVYSSRTFSDLIQKNLVIRGLYTLNAHYLF